MLVVSCFRAQWAKVAVKGNGPAKRAAHKNIFMAFFFTAWKKLFLSMDTDGLSVFERKSSTSPLIYISLAEMESVRVEQLSTATSTRGSRSEDNYCVILTTKLKDEIFIRYCAFIYSIIYGVMLLGFVLLCFFCTFHGIDNGLISFLLYRCQDVASRFAWNDTISKAITDYSLLSKSTSINQTTDIFSTVTTTTKRLTTMVSNGLSKQKRPSNGNALGSLSPMNPSSIDSLALSPMSAHGSSSWSISSFNSQQSSVDPSILSLSNSVINNTAAGNMIQPRLTSESRISGKRGSNLPTVQEQREKTNNNNDNKDDDEDEAEKDDW